MEGVNHVVVETREGQVASASLTLDPADEVRKRRSEEPLVRPDLAVECFASHRQLGDDKIAYTHVVQVICEFVK